MIDEKKLIEDIEKEFDGVCVYDVSPSQAINDFVQIIDRQPKVGEWIPVSKRLPEENKNSEYYDSVIVTLDDGRVANGCYINVDEEWWVDAEDGENYSINATGHVVAWMPLPKAYKEEVN